MSIHNFPRRVTHCHFLLSATHNILKALFGPHFYLTQDLELLKMPIYCFLLRYVVYVSLVRFGHRGPCTKYRCAYYLGDLVFKQNLYSSQGFGLPIGSWGQRQPLRPSPAPQNTGTILRGQGSCWKFRVWPPPGFAAITQQ